MCQCFSFLTDRNGGLHYINQKDDTGEHSPDSHSYIAKKYELDEDKMNKYEYDLFTKKLTADSIVFDEDIEKVRKAIPDIKLTSYWQVRAVKQNGRAICYITNPTPQVQLAAVKQNGYAICYITNPTSQVQLAAVKQDGRAIQYIKNPTKEVREYYNNL